MSEWREVTLDELGRVERGRSRHRPRNDPRLFGGSTPFFQTGDVKAAELHLTEASQFYSEFGLSQSRTAFSPGVTCITIAANTAETAVLGVRGCFPDSVIGFTPEEGPDDAYFVKYLLDVERPRLSAAARGTTQENLSLEKLAAHRFRVPGPTVRRAIALSLRAHDELIENIRQRIGLLERMAQAIYREWFVHFRYPGHEDDELIDSPLGPIPIGWDVRPLFEEAEVSFGFALKSKGFGPEGEWPVIRIRDVPTGSTPTFTDEFPGDRYVVDDGDTLIGMDGEFHMCRWSGGRALLNQRVTRVRPKQTLGAEALFWALRVPISEWNERIVGTTVAHLGKSHLDRIALAVPPAETAGSLNGPLDSLGSLAIRLRRSSRVLAGLRDLLLPKLVTGAIDVSRLDLDALLADQPA